ncbi:hypothetical protein ACJX0J_008996, partial [Zea mays]
RSLIINKKSFNHKTVSSILIFMEFLGTRIHHTGKKMHFSLVKSDPKTIQGYRDSVMPYILFNPRHVVG